MALTERAMQVVQTPLRLVQQATGTDTNELRTEIEQVIRPLRTELQDLDRRLTAIESKIDDIHDDTQHIRTEQAAEQTGEGN